MLKRKKNEKDKAIDITSLNQILKTSKKIINIGYFMAIICVILLAVYLAKELHIFSFIKEFLIVISPIFIGIIIAWLFDPLVTTLQDKKIPRILGCILVYLALIGFLFLLGYLVIPSFVNQLRDFVSVIPSIFDNITDFVSGFIQNIDTNGFIDLNSLKNQVTDSITEYGINLTANIPKYVMATGKTIISGGINFVLGLMIGFYLLYDFNKVNDYVISIIPASWEDGYTELTTRINTSLRNYVQGVLLVMLLVFITQTIGLTLAGLEAPILFALFCAITDIIPYFGPYIGAIPAIIVGFTISPITGICVIISIVVVQLLENNFYQPIIMGHTMKLHPVTIMLGLLIFGHFFGIIGMVIATPVIACVKVLFNFINEKLELREKIVGDDKEIKAVE